jgi:hypothetical protein
MTIKSPSAEITSREHRGCSEWTDGCSETIEAVQESQDLIRLRHISNPRIPTPIDQAIAEAYHDVEDNHDRKRWTDGDYKEGDAMTSCTDNGNPTLPKARMDFVVGCCGKNIADEG